MLTGTYKKQYNEILQMFPDNKGVSNFRRCTIFFKHYFNIPNENEKDFETMINRINGDFFTAISENKSIRWLLKNGFINAGFLVTSIGNFRNEHINDRQYFKETD